MNPKEIALQHIKRGELLQALHVIEDNNIIVKEDIAYHKFRLSTIESDFQKGLLTTVERSIEINKLVQSVINRLTDTAKENDEFKSFITKLKNENREILNKYPELIFDENFLEIRNLKWKSELYSSYGMILFLSVLLIGAFVEQFTQKPIIIEEVYHYAPEQPKTPEYLIWGVLFFFALFLLGAIMAVQTIFQKIIIDYNTKKIVVLPQKTEFRLRDFDNGYGNLNFNKSLDGKDIIIIDYDNVSFELFKTESRSDYMSMKRIFNSLYVKMFE
jgi:hypothetical protein